jgi:hypothetical protein
MQGPAGEAAVGQMAINGGKAEGEGFCFFGPKPLHSRQQATQFLGHDGAISYGYMFRMRFTAFRTHAPPCYASRSGGQVCAYGPLAH